MSKKPWENWIPGVLSEKQIKELIDSGYLKGVMYNIKAVDASSIDLYITKEGYRLTKGSVKPSKEKDFLKEIIKQNLVEELNYNRGGYILKKENTYLFKLHESINIPKGIPIYGEATARSSVGRMDVLARLIVDGMESYERFTHDGLNKGEKNMYIEVTPMTFNVRVKPGISLSQLRLFYGKPENVEIHGAELYNTILGEENTDGSLSVDLTDTNIYYLGKQVSAFCAKESNNNNDFLDLWEHDKNKKPDPKKYWEPKYIDKDNRLIIEKNKFYILKSREKISVPPGIAVYCRAIDETIGEMRIHYAGFAHPYFGMKRNKNIKKPEKQPTPLIFEVRGHNVDVSLKNGEILAKLIFYRMSQDSLQSKGAYTNQKLELSKFFRDWPEKIKINDDKTVEPIIEI